MNNNPIGVYDSGFGGLSVWRVLHGALPSESLVYLGDGKNCPYGNRSNEEIRELADEAVGELLARGCKLIVVACNTATAAAIEYLRAKYAGVPFVGLEPAVKPACLSTRSGIVGVLATARSLEGDLFRRTSARYADKVRIIAAVGDGFVEIVENDEEESPETLEKVRRVLEPLVSAGADRIVLGFTHYPFLVPAMMKVIGSRDVEIVDSGRAVERRVEQLLDEYGLRADAMHKPVYEFVTFADEEYRQLLERKAFGNGI